jgi:hypothetical protein
MWCGIMEHSQRLLEEESSNLSTALELMEFKRNKMERKFKNNEIWLIAENSTAINLSRISKFFISHPERQDTAGIYVKSMDERTVIRLCSTISYNEGMRGIQYILWVASLGLVSMIRCGTPMFWKSAGDLTFMDDEPFEERPTAPRYRPDQDRSESNTDYTDPQDIDALDVLAGEKVRMTSNRDIVDRFDTGS